MNAIVRARCRWFLASLIGVAAVPWVASPAPVEGPVRVAQARLDVWGNFRRIGDMWRFTETFHSITVRKDALTAPLGPQDIATVRTTRCRQLLSEAKDGNGEWTLFRAGRTYNLSVVSQSCHRSRSQLELPQGSFAFDENLGGATLTARIGDHAFDIVWQPYGDARTSSRRPDAGDAGRSGSVLGTGLTFAKERDAHVTATIDGRYVFDDCFRLILGSSRCFLRSVEGATATV